MWMLGFGGWRVMNLLDDHCLACTGIESGKYSMLYLDVRAASQARKGGKYSQICT